MSWFLWRKETVMRKLTALAAVALLGGCAGLGTADFAPVCPYRAEAILTAEPRPAIAGAMEDEEPFVKWAGRLGVVMSSTSADDMDPRVTLGAYARFLESDTGRLEAGVDVVPDFGTAPRMNLYVSFAADYVGFIGEGGLYWKAGGGGILEIQDEKMFFLMLMEGGVGFWIPFQREDVTQAFVVNVMLQRPMIATADSENNAELLLAITAGYEF